MGSPSAKSLIDVLDTRIAYVEAGAGDPIVFLHGNPTSSYLWRNVIPHVADLGRCLAPDIAGMGDSGRPGGAYRLADHQRYVDAFLEAVGAGERVVLVLHDWGSALGFDWARRHEDAVRGIAYMEAVVKPVTWDDWPEGGRRVFQGMRSDAGEEMVLEKNVFVERILPASILGELTPADMDEYRRPWLEPGESRRPMLAWPRELPIDGEPADVVATVETYGRWLERTPVPKLFVNAEPGSILVGAQREYARGFPAQTEVTVAGSHFVQEDSPDEIGRALADWLRALPN